MSGAPHPPSAPPSAIGSPAAPSQAATSATANAAQKASPTVLKTLPPLRSIPDLSAASWSASDSDIEPGSDSHLRVLPSMSVKRKTRVSLSVKAIGSPAAGSMPPP